MADDKPKPILPTVWYATPEGTVMLGMNVTWDGTDEARQKLFEAIHHSCPKKFDTERRSTGNYSGQACGSLPNNCSLCTVLHDQAQLDRFWHWYNGMRYTLAEWYEADREGDIRRVRRGYNETVGEVVDMGES